MNDEVEEVVEVDPEHPWVEAAVSMRPQPLPAAIQIQPVELPPREEGQPNLDAAMVTMVTPAGVMTCFVSPNVLAGVLQQGSDLLQYWQKRQQQGLVVANPEMERMARKAADEQAKVEKLFRG